MLRNKDKGNHSREGGREGGMVEGKEGNVDNGGCVQALCPGDITCSHVQKNFIKIMRLTLFMKTAIINDLNTLDINQP